MATPRRRHATPPSGSGVSGSLWPVQLAIFALASSIAVMVMANGDFPNLRAILDQGWSRLVQSSWIHLAADAVLLTILLGASQRMRGVARRRIEFAVLVSLLMHFWLAVYLHHQYLPSVAAQTPDRRDGVEGGTVEPVLPDYHWRGIDRPDVIENFQRPVETLASNPSQAAKVRPRLPEAPSQAKLARAVEPLRREQADKVELAKVDAPQPQRPESAVAKLQRRQVSPVAATEEVAMPELRSAAPVTEPSLRPTTGAEAARRRDPGNSGGATVRTESVEPRMRASSSVPADVSASPLRRDALDPLPTQRAQTPKRTQWGSGRVEVAEADMPAAAEAVDPTPEAAIQARATPRGGVAMRSAPPIPRAEQVGEIGAEQVVVEEVAASRGRLPIGGPLRRDEPTSSLPGGASLPRSAVAGDAPALTPARVEEPSPTATGGSGSGGSGSGGNLTRRGNGGGTRGSSEPDGAVRAAPSMTPVAGDGLTARAESGVFGPSADADAMRPRLPGGPAPSDGAGGIGSAGSASEATSPAAAMSTGGAGGSVGIGVLRPVREALSGPAAFGAGAGRGLALAKSGGLPSIDSGVHDTPAQMFLQRDPERRGRMARSFGAGDDTERAVELGIAYLLRHQFPDGRWAIDRFPQGRRDGYGNASPGSMNADTAATGLSLLALLGAGYTHQEGKHQAEVRRGIQWLVANQQADGRLGDERTDRAPFARMYGHAMAAIALCEAYGMTSDPALREPTRKAIRFIVASQHSEQGGWRYTPGEESDTSVSGWKLMALKSAQMAGIEVPKETLSRVGRWLDAAQADRGARYAYNPVASDTPEQLEGRRPSLAMTAEGLLMRLYLGWDRKRPALTEGADWLLANPPALGTASEPTRDAYYWYYATQVMFQLQGPAWQQWNARMRPLSVRTQQTEGPLSGSWSPQQPVPDRWGSAGGRHYVTTMHLLMLEVYYRHLPLFRLEQE